MSNELITAEVQRFELEQRRAKAFSLTAFFPQHLKGSPDVSVANAIIVYDIASRMNLSPLEVAQSIFIIHGKPSFETKFLVARLNSSGLLKGRLQTIVSENGQSAYCEAIDAETGAVLRGTTITMDMARREGWLSKNGSKWQTMPTLMLKYRAQSFFINEFFPEVRLGLRTKEEVQDIVEVEEATEPKTDLNQLLNSTISKTENVPENATVKENLTVGPVEVEIESDDITLGGDTPHQILENELIKRGATPDEAEDLVSRYNVEAVNEILQDPNSIDNMIENLRG